MSKPESLRIIECKTDQEIIATQETMLQLRPSLPANPQEYLGIIKTLQTNKGYILLSLLNQQQQCCAVAGYELTQRLATGSTLYIADFVTDQAQRSKGYGAYLLDFIYKKAQKLNLDGVTLDSGLKREEAHRFYEREGFEKKAYHFIKQ